MTKAGYVQKGARGTDGRIYPWGDEWDPGRCNTWEAGIGDTTPVGAYPEGASFYGLLDMAGNVLEWTRSLYRAYPYDAEDGREDLDSGSRRVLRGGSFLDVARLVRCAYCVRDAPDSRDGVKGFRVCVVAQQD